MERLLQDLRYGARTLVSKPVFTIVAVLALALGIGANSAIFSVVNGVLLKPLPYKDPDRLIMIWERNQARGLDQQQASPITFVDWRDQTELFEQIAGWWHPQVNLTEPNTEPARVRAIDISGELFSVLGVQPFLGRSFLPGEDAPGQERVTILSHALWQRRFNSDPNIIGKPVTLDGRSYSVVGIMPAGFDYPEKTEVWRPLGWNPAQHNRGARFFEVVARLQPGVTLERAQAELNALAQRIEQDNPRTNTDWSVKLVTLHDQIVGNFRSALLILLGAVGFVLLIACANVANLLLARAASRSKEVAIRTALGAGRLRLVRQFLTESLLLAFIGGAVGLALAYLGTKFLVSLNPINIPRLGELSLDFRVLSFTLATVVLTGLVFGLVPALQASRADLNQVLKEGGRSSGASFSGHRIRSALVVAEVAIALVLLIGAGLLLKSFIQLQRVDPGFNPSNVMTMNIQLPSANYSDWRQVSNFYSQLLERVNSLPGVQSADSSAFLPLETGWRSPFRIDGQPVPPEGEEPTAQYHFVSEGFFGTMGIPLLGGRELSERDNADTPGVVLINQEMARRYFADQDPIGKRLIETVRNFGPLGRTLMRVQQYEIIGIVGNVKNGGLSAQPDPAMYFSQRQFAYRSMSLLVRASANTAGLTDAVRGEVWSLDRNLPVSNVATVDQLMSDSVARPRFSMYLLAGFAALAMILAAVGIYGVMSYSVSQRTHEIGLRMALGAQSTDILQLVVRQGMMMVLIGVAIGLAGAIAVTRVMSGLLFGVSATDPVTFAIVSLLLAGVALLANYVPARKAMKVDPMIALRYE